MDVKRGIASSAECVEELKKLSKRAGLEGHRAASERSRESDESIGKTIADAMEKVGKEGVITVEEGSGLDNELEVVEGMQFERLLSRTSSTTPQNQTAELEKPLILLADKKISNIREMPAPPRGRGEAGRPLLSLRKMSKAKRSRLSS